jgi:nonsense-mediated mRNA decay protein 3
MEIDSDTQT